MENQSEVGQKLETDKNKQENTCIAVLILTHAVAIFEQLFQTNITHLVSADSYEGSFEEDAELCKCTCRKSMAFHMSSILTK